MAQAFIGLGANLGAPERQVRAALDALDEIPRTRKLANSSLYRSAPIGCADQADFINAVAQVETAMDPHSLLDELLRIELRFGRERSERNGPRTLDLDLLLFDDVIIEEPGLTVPHPRIHSRAFVLAPLAEIAPQLRITGKGLVQELLAECRTQRIARIQI